MPQRCKACGHKNRSAIDSDLIRGVPVRIVAQKYGLAKSSAQRHYEGHLKKELAKAREDSAQLNSERLLSRIDELYMKAGKVLSRAEKAEDSNLTLRAIKECRDTMETIGKLVALVQAERRLSKAEHDRGGIVICVDGRPSRKTTGPIRCDTPDCPALDAELYSPPPDMRPMQSFTDTSPAPVPDQTGDNGSGAAKKVQPTPLQQWQRDSLIQAEIDDGDY